MKTNKEFKKLLRSELRANRALLRDSRKDNDFVGCQDAIFCICTLQDLLWACCQPGIVAKEEIKSRIQDAKYTVRHCKSSGDYGQALGEQFGLGCLYFLKDWLEGKCE